MPVVAPLVSSGAAIYSNGKGLAENSLKPYTFAVAIRERNNNFQSLE